MLNPFFSSSVLLCPSREIRVAIPIDVCNILFVRTMVYMADRVRGFIV